MSQRSAAILVALFVAAALLFAAMTAYAAKAEPATYAKGEKVQVLWKGSWYAAAVLEVGAAANAGKYKVRYDGYDASWDEWVGPDRMKKAAPPK